MMPEPVLPSDADATEEVGSTPDCTSSPDIPANESLTSANAAPTTENSSMIRTPCTNSKGLSPPSPSTSRPI